MEKVIITTPDELRSIIYEAVNSKSKIEPRQDKRELSDNLTLEGAMSFLRENGFPTSKAKLYKLTSAKKIPFRKYGNKLVFSRKALLEWAHLNTISFDNDDEGAMAVIRDAKRKSSRS